MDSHIVTSDPIALWLAAARRRLAVRIADLAAREGAGGELALIAYTPVEDIRRIARELAVDEPLPPPAEAPPLTDLPVARMLAGFGLPPGLAPLMALLVLAEVEARIGTVLGWLNDDIHQRSVTPACAVQLLGPLPLPPAALLVGDGPLRRFHLLDLGPPAPLVSRPMRLPDTMLRWLLGRGGPDPALAGHLLAGMTAPLPVLLPDDESRRPFAAARPPLVLTGAEGSGRAAIAAAMAGPALTLDARHLAEDAARLLALAQRDAVLAGAVLVVAHADRLPVPVLSAALAGAPGPLILTAAARLPQELPHLAVPPLGAARRRALWRHALGEAETAEAMAHRFRLPVADILAIGAQPGPRDLPALSAECLSRSSDALHRLAQPIPPRHDWADLVLPDRQIAALRGIAARATHAHQVYDLWGFGEKLAPHRGLTALFTGPSGAGKTMSAGIVARTLGLPLFRVDLSATVSKYIGETEKNLDRIFAAAESGNACLFFDECDALFGKRSEVSDAHDRYANIETSYLLQRLEVHRGVVMMASNFPQNIDDAFSRRIDVRVEFPMPDAHARAELWARLLPARAEAAIDCAALGQRFELSGGTIRNALLAAAFDAAAEGGPITTGHCLRAVAREYEKQGKPLTRADFGEAFVALRRGG